jgi:hypothetical protein
MRLILSNSVHTIYWRLHRPITTYIFFLAMYLTELKDYGWQSSRFSLNINWAVQWQCTHVQQRCRVTGTNFLDSSDRGEQFFLKLSVRAPSASWRFGIWIRNFWGSRLPVSMVPALAHCPATHTIFQGQLRESGGSISKFSSQARVTARATSPRRPHESHEQATWAFCPFLQMPPHFFPKPHTQPQLSKGPKLRTPTSPWKISA